MLVLWIRAYLVVMHKVKPRHNVEEDTRVSGVSRRNTLHVWAQRGDTVKWLALLDLGDHLFHVHVDLAGVLGEAVETDCCGYVSCGSCASLQ